MKKAILSILSLSVFSFGTLAVEDVLTDTLPEVMVVNNREQMLRSSVSNQPEVFYLRTIEQQQISSAKDFTAFVPSLHIPEYGSAMTSSIYMRGLGARIDNPVVGVYIDGIGLANKNSFDFHFLDIRSAEMFRGPQGTLFGRNTIGGVLNLRTISPLAYQGTRATLSYANQNSALAQVSHYAKLTDNFGLGAGAYYRHTDGYFRNQYDGKLTDWSHNAGAMLKLEHKQDSDLKIINNLNYNFVKQGAFPYHLESQPVNHNGFCGYLRHSLTEGLNVEINFDDITLSSLTSYQLLHDQMDMDQDYLPYSYFTLRQKQTEHFIEQNFVLRNRTNSVKSDSFRWDWLAGLSVSYKQNQMSAPVTFMRDGIDTIILANANVFGDNIRYNIRDNQFTIYSDFITSNTDVGFYHTSYLTWNRWQLELGLRLEYEQSLFRYDSYGRYYYNFVPYITEYTLLESKFNGNSALRYLEILPRVAASYKQDGWTVFASIAEGYKAGGFNTQLFSDIIRNDMMLQMMGKEMTQDVESIITYKPERCLTSEVGARYNYVNTDFSSDVELRFYDNELFNQQLTVFPKNTTGRMMTNAGRSRSLGVELTGNVRYKGFTFDLSYGYTHARFLLYQSGVHNYAGKHIPYIPDNTLALSAAYKLTFEHDIVNSLVFALGTKAIGAIYWDNENMYKQPIYGLLNANITLSMQYVSLSLWGQNLTNTKYDVFYFESMNNVFMQSGKPITYGITLKLEI